VFIHGWLCKIQIQKSYFTIWQYGNLNKKANCQIKWLIHSPLSIFKHIQIIKLFIDYKAMNKQQEFKAFEESLWTAGFALVMNRKGIFIPNIFLLKKNLEKDDHGYLKILISADSLDQKHSFQAKSHFHPINAFFCISTEWISTQLLNVGSKLAFYS